MIYNSTNIIILCAVLLILFFVLTNKADTFVTKPVKYNTSDVYVDLILYHADWCGHCKAFKSIWANLLNVIKSSSDYDVIKPRDINCTYNTSKDLISPQGSIIYGFPTVVVCIRNKNTNEIINEYSYDNERSVDSILEFIKEKLI